MTQESESGIVSNLTVRLRIARNAFESSRIFRIPNKVSGALLFSLSLARAHAEQCLPRSDRCNPGADDRRLPLRGRYARLRRIP